MQLIGGEAKRKADITAKNDRAELTNKNWFLQMVQTNRWPKCQQVIFYFNWEYTNGALFHSNELQNIKTVEEKWSCMPFYPKHLTIFGFRRTSSLITAVSINLFKRYQLWRLAVR